MSEGIKRKITIMIKNKLLISLHEPTYVITGFLRDSPVTVSLRA